MNPIERRQLVLEYLNVHRQATYKELATHFGVSKNTIITDVTELTCSAPIYTVNGNGGGIRVSDEWYIGRRYLHSDQENLLRKLLPRLKPEDRKTMESILYAFAKPKANGESI